MAKTFGGVQRLASASEEELTALENIGEITARAVTGWFADADNAQELELLLSAGIVPKASQKAEGVFSGEYVVLTGTLTKYKRSEAQKIIEELGGECQSAVTSKTTLVVAGESAGSKLEKARKLGAKIIDEAKFEEIISSEN